MTRKGVALSDWIVHPSQNHDEHIYSNWIWQHHRMHLCETFRSHPMPLYSCKAYPITSKKRLTLQLSEDLMSSGENGLAPPFSICAWATSFIWAHLGFSHYVRNAIKNTIKVKSTCRSEILILWAPVNRNLHIWKTSKLEAVGICLWRIWWTRCS